MPEQRPPVELYPDDDGPPTRNEIGLRATHFRTQMARILEITGAGGFEPVQPEPSVLSTPEQKKTSIRMETEEAEV